VKILLVTPLYPPDIAQPAPYVKELATRLSNVHERGVGIDITIVTYGSHPEKIPNVQILTTSKHRPLLLRIFLFTALLIQPIHASDIVIFENGASVELPVSLLLLFIRKKFVFHISDTRAHTAASTHSIHGKIEQFARNHANVVMTDMPLERPEILPLEPYPSEAFTAYEKSWQNHLKKLVDTCIK
jgi:hypothetical protein